MGEYTDIVVIIVVMWSLAAVVWYFFNDSPSERKDSLGNGMMGIICLVLVVGAYIYQADREYPPNNGGDHAYYAREAGIKKQIKRVLSRKDSGKKPARRLNEDLNQKDVPIEDMIRKFWKSDRFL